MHHTPYHSPHRTPHPKPHITPYHAPQHPYPAAMAHKKVAAGFTIATMSGAQTAFSDSSLYSRFSIRVPDAQSRFALRAEIERRKGFEQKSLADRSNVILTSCEFLEDGFVLEMKRPCNTRVAYAFWKRVVDALPGFDVQGSWRVVGELQPSAAKAAASGAKPQRRCRAKTPEPEAACKRACDETPPGALPVLPHPVAAPTLPEWPQFKLRRLLGALEGEDGMGGSASCYPLFRRLGGGSYGQVYASSIAGTDLAVKVVEREKKLAALQEVAIAERVTGHPHLVDLKEAVRGPRGQVWLVYAHAGSSLPEFVASKPMAQLPLAQLTGDCLKGLAHLHRLGLFHTDIKPVNILIKSGQDGCFGQAVLGDLGSVVEVGSGKSRIGHVLTTLWYRSPEILHGQAEAVGAQWLRADIWSLGISLCDILGLTFFKKAKPATLLEALRSRLEGRRLELPAVPWRLMGSFGADFLEGILQWAPMDRPTAEEGLAHEFLRPPVFFGHLGARQPPLFKGRRHQWTLVQGCMSLALSVPFAFGFVHVSPHIPTPHCTPFNQTASYTGHHTQSHAKDARLRSRPGLFRACSWWVGVFASRIRSGWVSSLRASQVGVFASRIPRGPGN